MADSSLSRQQEILKIMMWQSTKKITLGVIFVELAAVAVAGLLWPVVSHLRIGIWLLLSLLVHLSYLWILIELSRNPAPTSFDLTKRRWARIVGLVMAASTWAWVPIFLWPHGLPEYQIGLAMTIILLCAATVISYPGINIAYVSYTYIALGPLLIRLVLEGTRGQYWAAIIGTLYIPVIFWLGRSLKETLRRAIITGIENRELGQEISHKEKQTEMLNRDLHLKNSELQAALEKIKSLSGMLPICANCKKIRDDQGYYQQIEHYITEHSEVEFTHGICPDCAELLYPGIDTTTSTGD